MKNFNFGGRSRDRRDFSGRNSGGRDSRKPEMHEAVCDECGKDCRVPFKPSSGKPVFCSDCFEKKGGRDSNRSGRGGSHRQNFENRDQWRSPGNNLDNRSISQLADKIEILNTKLETIIGIISAALDKKQKPEKEISDKSKKTKITKAKDEKKENTL